MPRGKLLGGSSSINGMVFVRGQAQDYDTWAQLGNRGWSYREVLPIFRDMESFQGDADEEYRGRSGPLKVTESNESGAIYEALIKAAGQVGIPYTKDYNGASQDGIGMTQATIRGGRRMSTAVCYLDPARRRPNLSIVANALTQGLLFDGKRCVGIVTRTDIFTALGERGGGVGWGVRGAGGGGGAGAPGCAALQAVPAPSPSHVGSPGLPPPPHPPHTPMQR